VTARLGAVRWPKRIGRSFENRAELERELRRAQPLNSPAAPAFDFTRARLVLAAAGPRSSTGYVVRVVRVVERRDRVDVDVREVAPSLHDRVEATLTFPYRLLAIPASGKRVQVRWEGRS
jgi:protease stability complex PrcB-like protein